MGRAGATINRPRRRAVGLRESKGAIMDGNGRISLDERLSRIEAKQDTILHAVSENGKRLAQHETLMGIFKWSIGGLWALVVAVVSAVLVMK